MKFKIQIHCILLLLALIKLMLLEEKFQEIVFQTDILLAIVRFGF